jgi:tripartite-type tricarboxylate transporter receptor subunit TctC
MRTFLSTAILIVGLVAGAEPAVAQQYPVKAVRIVVGFAPGGINDIVARLIGQKLNEALGQPFVVENRAGAGGTIGADFVAKAKPDGYIVLLGSVSNIVIATNQYRLPYDPQKDFAPVSLVAAAPNILVVYPSLPVHTLKDLIALARKHPGEISFSSAGNGASGHLTGELLRVMTGINVVHVPYKGDAPAMTAVIAGEIPFHFAVLPVALPHIKAGRLRAIVVSSAKRTALAPEVPTAAESGLPGFEVSVWVGLLAPTGTPAAIVERLHQEAAKATRTVDIREKLAVQGVEPVGSSPSEFAAVINADMAKWRKVAKAAGITP